jgi:hypothetical protein
MCYWLYVGCGLVIGFIEHLYLVTTGICSSFYGSAHFINHSTAAHIKSCCLHWSLPGNGSQQCRFLSFPTDVLTGWQLSCNSLMTAAHGSHHYLLAVYLALNCLTFPMALTIQLQDGPHRRPRFQHFLFCCAYGHCHYMFTKPLPSSGWLLSVNWEGEG